MSSDPSTLSLRWRRFLLLGSILLLGLGLRLYEINEPPDDYHCWRQSQTLMVAHSFHERDMNILHPRVYWRNTVDEPVEPEGIAGGTELSVTPWLTAVLYKVFGTANWVGRVAPIFFSLAGLVFFFLFVERMAGLAGAASATFLLCISPMYLFFGRVQMPESFALACSFATLHCFNQWLKTRRTRHFLLALLACTLMLLGKPTMAFMALPLFFLVLLHLGSGFFREWRLYLFAAITGGIFLIFTWYSFKVLSAVSGLVFYVPGLLSRDVLLDGEFYQRMAESIWSRAVGWPLLVLALPALLLPLRRAHFFPHAWLAGVLCFFVFAANGNLKNDYYQLVLAPPAACLAGLGVQRFLWHGALRWAVPPLLAVAAWLLIPLAAPMYADPVGENFRRAGEWLRENTPEDTLVLCSHPNPATLYFADRTGWTCWYEHKGPIKFEGPTIAMARRRGASVLVVPDGDKLDNAYFENYRNTRDYLYEHYYCARGDNFAVFFVDVPPDLTPPEDGIIHFGSFDSRKYLRGRWGRDFYAESQAAWYTDLRYEKEGALRIDFPAGVTRLVLRVSSPVAGNSIAFRLDGQELGSTEFPRAWQVREIALDIAPDQVREGLRTLQFEVSRQKDNLIGMLLWSVRLEPVTP